jgi:hypothetical protein
LKHFLDIPNEKYDEAEPFDTTNHACTWFYQSLDMKPVTKLFFRLKRGFQSAGIFPRANYGSPWQLNSIQGQEESLSIHYST